MKTFLCDEKRAGKLCENDKFCTKPGEECLCHNQCMEKRCREPGKFQITIIYLLIVSRIFCHLICEPGNFRLFSH